jgi:hypothetical protein
METVGGLRATPKMLHSCLLDLLLVNEIQDQGF